MCVFWGLFTPPDDQVGNGNASSPRPDVKGEVDHGCSDDDSLAEDKVDLDFPTAPEIDTHNTVQDGLALKRVHQRIKVSLLTFCSCVTLNLCLSRLLFINKVFIKTHWGPWWFKLFWQWVSSFWIKRMSNHWRWWIPRKSIVEKGFSSFWQRSKRTKRVDGTTVPSPITSVSEMNLELCLCAIPCVYVSVYLYAWGFFRENGTPPVLPSAKWCLFYARTVFWERNGKICYKFGLLMVNMYALLINEWMIEAVRHEWTWNKAGYTASQSRTVVQEQ